MSDLSAWYGWIATYQAGAIFMKYNLAFMVWIPPPFLAAYDREKVHMLAFSGISHDFDCEASGQIKNQEERERARIIKNGSAADSADWWTDQWPPHTISANDVVHSFQGVESIFSESPQTPSTQPRGPSSLNVGLGRRGKTWSHGQTWPSTLFYLS